MTDPLFIRFSEACNSAYPLSLRVDLPDGGVLAEGTVKQPFTLIGRDDACDVTLSDPDVNLRHAWLQVINGRLFAVDLASRTGLIWPTGTKGSGWLDVASAVHVGPFRVQLRSPVSDRPIPPQPGLSPLQGDPAGMRSRPNVVLEFRNGKRAKDRWVVNRPISIIGRSSECKIHLHTEDIAAFHCGLVLTQSGLWVVDLSGQGVVVNGARMRVAPLAHGSELWVGKFLIGCQYTGVLLSPAAARHAELTPPTPLPGLSSDARVNGSSGSSGRLQSTSQRRPPPQKPRVNPDDEEVLLGVQPPNDPAAGLPSSHIMADAFEILSSGGSLGFDNSSMSASINNNAPNAAAPSAGESPSDPPRQSKPNSDAAPDSSLPTNVLLAQLLKQLGDVHGQMFEQFQQSMMLMMKMFGQIQREQVTAIRHELGHIQELNGELTKLQTEVARLALAQAFGKTAGSTLRPGLTSANPTPLPGTSISSLAMPTSQASVAAAAIEDWVVERIDTLRRERQTRWDKLVVLAEKPE